MNWGQTLKQLTHDLKDAKFIDFITSNSEIEQLKKYKEFNDMYYGFRMQGGNPDGFGVIVARGHKDGKKDEGFMQFFLLSKDTVDRLGNLMNKKKKEWSSEDQAFMIDDNPQDKKHDKNLIEVNPNDNLIDTANPNVKLDLSYLDPSFKI